MKRAAAALTLLACTGATGVARGQGALEFIPAAPDLPAEHPLDLPLHHVNRPLVLPRHVIAPYLAFAGEPAGPRVLQGANLALGAALGMGFNSELGASLTLPLQGVTHARVVGTLRAVGLPSLQIGLRLEMGLVHDRDGPSGGAPVLRPGLGVPIAIVADRTLRLDTGLFLSTWLPTDGESSATFLAFSSRSIDPSIEGAGVPLIGTFQPWPWLFLGAETGVGHLGFRTHQPGDEALGNVFVPLGAFIGATIPHDGRPLIEVMVNPRFPYFLLGHEDPATTDPWQVGVSLQVFAAL